MGAAGVGAVIGWCAVSYLWQTTARGWLAAATLVISGFGAADLAAGDSSGQIFLGASLVGGLAHAAMRRLITFGTRGTKQ